LALVSTVGVIAGNNATYPKKAILFARCDRRGSQEGEALCCRGFVRMLCVRLPVDEAYCGLDVDIGLMLNLSSVGHSI
jgi:hypothetical protein